MGALHISPTTVTVKTRMHGVREKRDLKRQARCAHDHVQLTHVPQMFMRFPKYLNPSLCDGQMADMPLCTLHIPCEVEDT